LGWEIAKGSLALDRLDAVFKRRKPAIDRAVAEISAPLIVSLLCIGG
jgi:hypothetical protein